MMNESILLYDVLDDNSEILNSQVILNDHIGFEIPTKYYFDKETTDLKKCIFHIIGDNNNFIKLYYEICNEKSYNSKIEEVREKYKVTEEFNNYRSQKIIEYENENGINIIGYDGTVIVTINSKCSKYSNEYYILYYILFSFDSDCQLRYENLYYQKNNYCILKNGYHIYNKYQINILKHNPSDTLTVLNEKSFCKYISNNTDYDEEINNYYLPRDKVFQNIIDKIQNYNNKEIDNPGLMDFIEE